ncbi:MAG: FtsK/SpoIIIE domain-containing protein [Oliverpabstia sp.]
MLTHQEFVTSLMTYIYRDRVHSSAELELAEYGPGKKVILLPEPCTFISEFDDFASSKDKCRKRFEELLNDFPRLSLAKAPEDGIWFNTTKKGINLRPGIAELSSRPEAVTMGDNAVHGLMAGQTGSGKSVLLNNLIFNLLMEYAPWELDLYLADFKRVEFSRYMNTYQTPHVSACAATSEIRYVLSLISYLVDCMNAREDFFARLGIDKIANFRNQYPNVVLPRMLLIVDEFQQLFLEASPKEGDKIRQLLTAIVKKGRATGFHILFASQEMSGTLSSSDLANFKLRFALNCNVGVSQTILGNGAAKNIRKGSVLVNQGDGTVESNVKFTVPLIETSEEEDMLSYFYEYLKVMDELASDYHFNKTKKFYKEEMQEPFEYLEDILERIHNYRRDIYLTEQQKYFDVLTLGSYVTFSNLRYDIQTLFLEYGRNKNIMAVSPKIEDLAYLEKLLSANFISSPREKCIGVPYYHEVYSFQPALRQLFNLERYLGTKTCYTNPDDIKRLELIFAKKKMMLRLCQENSRPLSFVCANYDYNIMQNSRRMSPKDLHDNMEKAHLVLKEVFGDIPLSQVPKVCQKVFAGAYSPEIKTTAMNLMDFYRYKENPYYVFPPTVYWIVGADSVERYPEWLLWMMKNGMDYNILFVIMANGDFDELTRLTKVCDYLFAGGNNSRLYDRMHMNYTHKSDGCIALDMTIKSMDEERSFKKYKCSFGKAKAPVIPFDEIL